MIATLLRLLRLRREQAPPRDRLGPATIYGTGGGATAGRRIWDVDPTHGNSGPGGPPPNAGRWP